MSDDTERKFFAAALKVFAEHGYVGATTVAIAEEAGFSEKTLFKTFKTKENLFNRTIFETGQEMMEDFEESVLVDREFKDPRELFETLIKNINKLGDDYFEYFHLSLRERTRISEPYMEKFNFGLSIYLKEHLYNENIDYMTLGLVISAVMYMLVTEKYMGRSAIDLDTVGKNFVDVLLNCIS